MKTEKILFRVKGRGFRVGTLAVTHLLNRIVELPALLQPLRELISATEFVLGEQLVKVLPTPKIRLRLQMIEHNSIVVDVA